MEEDRKKIEKAAEEMEAVLIKEGCSIYEATAAIATLEANISPYIDECKYTVTLGEAHERSRAWRAAGASWTNSQGRKRHHGED